MCEELGKRMQERACIYRQSVAILQKYGLTVAEAVCRMRDANPADYSAFLGLSADYYKADEAVWAERDRLYQAGIPYRMQP